MDSEELIGKYAQPYPEESNIIDLNTFNRTVEDERSSYYSFKEATQPLRQLAYCT